MLEGFCDALADLIVEQVRGSLQAQPDVVQAGGDRVEKLLAAVTCLKVDGHQGLDPAADQLGVLVAEHLLQPQVGQRERATAVGQRHPVVQRVD